MKKLFCLIISVLFTLSLCSCGMIYIDDSKEQKAYKDTVTSLFNALDNKDEEAVYQLFSPAVRAQDEDLKEQIGKLMSVYEGPTSEIGWNGLLAGGASYDNGEKSKDAYTTFPVRSEDTYYWCFLELMYENTADAEQIGIVQVAFYTTDEMYILRYDDTAKINDFVGLEVYAERTTEEDIRCISGWPHQYTPSAEALSLDDVKDFFKSSNRFADFKAHFGEPNAEHIYIYYELPLEEGDPRYLEIGTDDDDGTIYGASIVDDFEYVQTVYNEDDS